MTTDNVKEAAPEKEPEQQKDESRERIDTFLKEYGDLVNKHQVDFATYPVYVPDGQGGFKTITQTTPVDIKNQPKKSPFMAK